MRELLQKFRRILSKADFQDVCLFVGFVILFYGLSLVYQPAAYMVGGGLLIAYALVLR